MMRLLRLLLPVRDLRRLECSIEKLTEIRDSYRALNVEIYGEEIASILNDW